MTKSELIEQLTVDNDVLNKREAELIVNSIFDSIGQALIDGDRVEIRGFGSFSLFHHFIYSILQYYQPRTLNLELF